MHIDGKGNRMKKANGAESFSAGEKWVKRCLPAIFLPAVFSLCFSAAAVHADSGAATVQAKSDSAAEPAQIEASGYPTDMEVRPLVAGSVISDVVSVYTDAGLSDDCGRVDGEDLTFTIYKAEGEAIYADYSNGAEDGSGWFSRSVIVQDPDYEPVYATAKHEMYAYTTKKMRKIQGAIPRYRGVIVISKKGENRQVIYETEDGYAVGWIDDGDFSECLIYDGREKQVLADGTYLLRCGYQDDADGGVSVKKQKKLKKYTRYTMELIYSSDNEYYLKDTETGSYLAVKKVDGTTGWQVYWTETPDETALFHMSRLTGSFVIQSTVSRLFLGEDADGQLIFYENRLEDAAHWRCSAVEKEVDTEQPMVLTQYDPQWCGNAYGGGGTIGSAACGILSTVNAVYALSGQYMNVMELADFAVEKEYRIVDNGTDDGIFEAACEAFGQKYNFAWDGKSGSIETLKEKLKAGDVATAHVEGHYVCIAAYDEETDRYLLLDSNYLPKRATSAFGDWISPERFSEGSLYVQSYYFFKLRDAVK